MLTVSENFAKKIISDDRTFAVKVRVDSAYELTGATIQSISLDEIVNSTDTLTFGCACSNKVTINFINPPTNINYDNTYIEPYVSIKTSDIPEVYESVPLGKFYATEVETTNDYKNLKITAYDGFCKMTEKYIKSSSIVGTTKIQVIYDDIKGQLASKCGVVLKDTPCPDLDIEWKDLDMTFTQAVGYLAGCLGGFARFDREGVLEIVWYSNTTVEIPRNSQYMNGFQKTTDKPLTITSLVTGTQENTITMGDGVNGTEINYENPFITYNMVEAVWNKVNGVTYTPCKVKWRGNPAVQAGDIVSVIDKNNTAHTVFVMSQQIVIGGGLNSTIECKGKSETTNNFSNSFSTASQKIERVYTTMEQSVINATNSITGANGGYVIINDADGDGKPDEILILNSPVLEKATKCWRWNQNGLGFATNSLGNAYQGPYKLAIDTAKDGIVANFITAGFLNANRIAVESFDSNDPKKLTDYIHFGDGTITFGSDEDALTLYLARDKIELGNKGLKTKITSNSFEIDNMTDGVFRIQTFGFIPRKSGNISFTLVK
jgi:hypothetical protein